MKAKKLVSILLTLAMVGTMLVGCGGGSSDSSSEESTDDAAATEEAGDDAAEEGGEEAGGDGKYTIVMIPKLNSIPYFQVAGKGFEQAGKDLGVNAIVNGPATADAAQQATMIEDYINQGVDAICVAPNDPAAVGSVLKKAKDAGIVILDWDTQVEDGSLVDASVYNVVDDEFGAHMMDKLVEYMGTDEGQYAIITGGLSAANLNAWIKAAKERQEEAYPNLELVADPIPSDEKQDVAQAKAKEVISTYPELKGILGMSSPTGPGCGLAIQELGLQDKVALVANGIEADCQDVIADGSLDSGCLWDCDKLGYLTMVAAKYILDNGSLDGVTELEGMDGEKSEVRDNHDVFLTITGACYEKK